MLRGQAYPEVLHAKDAPCHAYKFHDAGVSQAHAEAVPAYYKADATNLQKISSPAEQRVFVRNMNTEPASKVREGIDDKEHA